MKKKLLIIGNDNLTKRLISEIRIPDDILVVIDTISTDKGRLLKLLLNGTLKLRWMIKLAAVEFFGKKCESDFAKIRSNDELYALIKENNIHKAYLFRAGMIIDKSLLRSGTIILNTHCARIPEYKGLCAIFRALENEEYDQEAVLFQITEKIDSGKIIDRQPYRLNKDLSYAENEEIAFRAGLNIIQRELMKETI